MTAADPLVLVVDDDPPVLRVMERTLERYGFDVAVAHGPLEALSHPALATARVLVTDVRMPDMDGYELATLVRERRPRLPVLIVSGSHQADDGWIGRPGPTRFLSKPFLGTELATAVRWLAAEGEAIPR